MARGNKSKLVSEIEKRHPRKRYIFGALLLGFGVLVVLLPQILTSRAVLPVLINRFAGLQPMRIQLADVRAGWLTPVEASGIEITAEDGTRLARIGKIETAKGLLGWISNSSDLGLLRISNLEAAAVASDGTTNIEQALAPLLTPVQTEEASTPEASTDLMRGTIQVVDCKLMLSEAGRPERWVLVIPNASVELPREGQLTGAVEFQSTITEVSGSVPNSTGSLSAKLLPAEAGAFEVRAVLDSVPVDLWHVIKARLPSLPIQELHGHLSGKASGNIVGDSAWSVSVQDLVATNLTMVAPELVGEAPVRLQSFNAAASCSLENALLHLVEGQLSCDFATATANAVIPWPLETPAGSSPFLPGATVNAQGSVDLPGMVAAAASLIPMRENTQLLEGTMQFSVNQQLDTKGHPASQAKLQLAGLKAIANDQEIIWRAPLTMAVFASEVSDVLSITADVSAEFAEAKVEGTIDAGTLSGNVDLSLLQQRLSQWVELPVREMQGTVGLGLQWNSVENGLIEATGRLNTTPVILATSTGGTLNEPAWKGDISCQLGVVDGAPTSINSAQLLLESSGEQLRFDLQQPLSLVADQGSVAPAAFAIDVRTDLASCTRRGNVWLTEPMDMDIRGNLQLVTSGTLDFEHLEVSSANWRCEPLFVATPQLTLSEPKVIGKFEGRVDTANLTRLVVDVLQVQSTSFSIGAEDQAKAGETLSRVGQAMWRVDLNRLMKNVGSESSVANQVGDTSAAKISATGILQGQLAWEVNPQAAGFNTRIDGQDIVVSSQSPGQPTPWQIWREPTAVANLAGTWLASSGAVDVQRFQLQLPWLNYDGKIVYDSSESSQAIRVTGQVDYDATQLASRLQPFTGDQVQLQGKQSTPIELTWTSPADSRQSFLTGLNASTRLGWEQGAVAGIPLGKADVPVEIELGRLQSAAEIPVSGGALRWNVTSDLAADELVIQQEPMLVLDNVQITDQMCEGWLKFVAPLLAKTTSVDGRLSLRLDQAALTPADPLRQSVTGQLIIHNATVGPGPLSNQIIFLAKQIENIRKQDFRTVSSTQKVWLNMPEQRIDFEMQDGKVVHRNLQVKVGDANITTAGSVGLDGQMELQATVPIPDDWAEKSQWLAGLRGQSLQFPIRGTLSNPQIDSQPLAQLGSQTVQNAADGLLRQGINRGLDKLLGGQDNATPEGASNPNPIQGIGEQILKGQGLSLPGLFPSLGGQQVPSNK